MRFLFVVLLSLSAMAGDLARAPRAFPHFGGEAVYVDFTRAEYHVRYDVAARTATVTSRITFTAEQAGHPIFDLAAEPTGIKLDGRAVGQALVATPDGATRVRVIDVSVARGRHVLEIISPLATLVAWEGQGVHSAFWSTDLADRGYLERYLPANMEFDRVPMILTAEFIGGGPQTIYANGEVNQQGNVFTVRFPEKFTSSSVFFHTVPSGAMAETRFTLRSIDGRDLPVVIYLKPGLFGGAEGMLANLKQNTTAILTELEADYGPFLHDSITIYNAGSGGMEYCGATMTSASALGHELTHSYFARGIIPANGNAGWIDEALASWRDNRYPRASGISGSANMAGRAGYTRFTDRAAYSYGAKFMAYLDGKYQAQGGLKPFLRKLVADKAFVPFTTEDFIGWGEAHFGPGLKAEFEQRVYSGLKRQEKSTHPFHRKLTLRELRRHL
jgi:hypothetical protein